LYIDTSDSTLGFFVEKPLKGRFAVNAPTIMLGSSEIYAEGDGLEVDEIQEFEANLPKVLANCPAGGIRHGVLVDIEDFSQNLKFRLVISHKPKEIFEEEGNADGFSISGDMPAAKGDLENDSEIDTQLKPLADKQGDNEVECLDSIIISRNDLQNNTKRSRNEYNIDNKTHDLCSKKAKPEDDKWVAVEV
jgi:ubiquitin-like 1-activating enzyme E1 B